MIDSVDGLARPAFPEGQMPWETYSPSKIQTLSLQELMSLSTSLQQGFVIDYKDIYLQSQKLKTLDGAIYRLSVKHLGGQTESGDSEDSNGSKNLLETVLKKVEMIVGDEANNAKTNARKRLWTLDEDYKLKSLLNQHGARNWKKIASFLDNRSDVQCLHRWQKVLHPQLIKGPWTKEEDDIVMKLVGQNGARNWSYVAKSLPGRIGKQCRERWHNHLNPDIKKERWTREEDAAIIQAHRKLGNRWAVIAKCLPGRTDNAIKNHWNSTIKRRLQIGSSSPDFPATEVRYSTPLPKSQEVFAQDYESVTKVLFNSPQKYGPHLVSLSLVLPVISKESVSQQNSEQMIADLKRMIYG